MAVINTANTTNVLMRLLCREMGLETNTTHIRFVETFSQIQNDARAYEIELQQVFKEGILKEEPKKDVNYVAEVLKDHVKNGIPLDPMDNNI